jgi:precorrin-3B methylase
LRSFSKIFRDDGNDFDDPSAEQVITRSWIIREDAGHRLQVADLAVDDAEECEDGGLVGGGDANMPGIARQFLCA